MDRTYKIKVFIFFALLALPTICGIVWSIVDTRMVIIYEPFGPVNVGMILELPWMLLLFVLFADEIFIPEESD